MLCSMVTFFDIKKMKADSFNPLCLYLFILLPLFYTIESASMNRFFQRKLAGFDILGIIYILELLKCLDFSHVEANNMFPTWNYT